LDRSKTNSSYTCLPGTSKVEGSSQCLNSYLIGKCDSQHKNSRTCLATNQFLTLPINHYVAIHETGLLLMGLMMRSLIVGY
jgi:hypothetical protein